MHSTLIILAAGMGSRFGGPKQIAKVGPSGETLLEYGLYDARAAGFSRFVFVLRSAILKDFEDAVLARFSKHLHCSIVLQAVEDLPSGVDPMLAQDRTKPWGTAHALWSARKAVTGPCAVINADDFYGQESFRQLHECIKAGESACLIPFFLRQTLSTQGGVSRGVCSRNADGLLESIQECRDLQMGSDGKVCGKINDTLEAVCLPPDTLVSMNLMGFSREVWPFLDAHIRQFFKKISASGGEYGLPDLLHAWMKQEQVKVIASSERWLGMTHKSDLERVRSEIAEKVAADVYPKNLWTEESVR